MSNAYLLESYCEVGFADILFSLCWILYWFTLVLSLCWFYAVHIKPAATCWSGVQWHDTD